MLGTVGEPINPEAWLWYYNVVGEGKCAVVDTFWQTETVSVECFTVTRLYCYLLFMVITFGNISY